jgi:hypothetical protein
LKRCGEVRFRCHDGTGKARHAQAEHRGNCAAHREVAALPRRPWRAQECKGQGGKGKRIDRRHQAVVHLGAELPRHLLVKRVIHWRHHQFPEISFTNSVGDVLAAIGELRHIESVAAERHHGGVGLARLETLQIAVFQNQERTILVLQHRAMVGNDGDALFGIATIINKNPDQQSAGLTLPDADSQVLIELSEAAGLQDIRQNVGGDLGVPALQPAHTIRCQI